jgi:glycosyltransferase involved in cell wall biosynthesis
MLAGCSDRLVWWQQDFPGRWRPGDRLAALLPASVVGACSEAIAKSQRDIHPSRPTAVVLPGIDPPTLVGDDEKRTRRAALGVPDGTPLVGIVGRLLPWKGQHNFLEAVALLRKQGVPLHAIVVGGNAYDLAPGYEEALHAQARRLGIENDVTFTGHVSDGSEITQLLDVSVNASVREPFGLVLLEAMASGVPVVAVDAAGPSEILAHRRSGWLAPSDRPSDLAEGIGALLSDPELRDRIVAEAKARFDERFRSERMAREMEALLVAQAGQAAQRASAPR